MLCGHSHIWVCLHTYSRGIIRECYCFSRPKHFDPFHSFSHSGHTPLIRFLDEMTILSASFLALVLSAQIVSGVTVGPVGEIVITNATVTLDGATRAAVLAGDSFPGPLVKGNKGDNFLSVNSLYSTVPMAFF